MKINRIRTDVDHFLEILLLALHFAAQSLQLIGLQTVAGVGISGRFRRTGHDVHDDHSQQPILHFHLHDSRFCQCLTTAGQMSTWCEHSRRLFAVFGLPDLSFKSYRPNPLRRQETTQGWSLAIHNVS